MNDDTVRIRKEVVVVYSRYNPSMSRGGLRKATKKFRIATARAGIRNEHLPNLA
jgi:hypothetical protein